MLDPARMTVAGALACLREGVVTCEGLVDLAIDRAEKYDVVLGSYHTRLWEGARAKARQLDEFGWENVRAPLAGVPVSVKTTFSVGELDCHVSGPARPSDSTSMVARLDRSGAILMGTSSSLEFSGAVESSDPMPVPSNPWDLNRWPGGSSSGAAVGVAASLVAGAIATDTGGSVRIPAAMCGVTGFLPSRGLLPTAGCAPLAPSLDRVGFLAKTVVDCSMLFTATVAPDVPTDRSLPDLSLTWPNPLAGVRIGVWESKESGPADGTRQRFSEAWSALCELGADVEEVSVPWVDEVVAATMLTIEAESLALYEADLRDHWEDFYPTRRLTMCLGAVRCATDYVNAQRALSAAKRATSRLLQDFDLIASPTLSAGAPPCNDRNELGPGLVIPTYAMYWNGVGAPAIAIPIGPNAEGLPVSMQLAGRQFEESRWLLPTAAAYQRHTDWHKLVPTGYMDHQRAPSSGSSLTQPKPPSDEDLAALFELLARCNLRIPAEELPRLWASSQQQQHGRKGIAALATKVDRHSEERGRNVDSQP